MLNDSEAVDVLDLVDGRDDFGSFEKLSQAVYSSSDNEERIAGRWSALFDAEIGDTDRLGFA